MNRYLTKSRFKEGLECVTKLYYTKKKDEYANQSLADPFLESLAEGGYQVGELAKYYFCDDPVSEKITITTLNSEEALLQTQEMLSKEGRVVIAEAAFLYENLFVRVDLLVKEGDAISIYEVKAKSYSDSDGDFMNKKGDKISTKWIPYVYDIAFQKYVISNALVHTTYTIKAFLTLVDKRKKSSISGINQFFTINKIKNRTSVEILPGLKRKDLGEKLLVNVPVDRLCDKIQYEFKVPTDISDSLSFEEFIKLSSDNYKNDSRLYSPLGSKCKKCQYRNPNHDNSLKDGFKECWKLQLGTQADLSKPLVTELWGGKAGSKSTSGELINNGVYFIENVDESDITPKSGSSKLYVGLSPLERRMEQVDRVKKNTLESYFDTDGFKAEMDTWTFPLHLIDFETSAVAIPFFEGMKPYETIAFQFSHHTVDKDWKVKHVDQYISFERGEFPNFEFLRKLKESLSNDDGTIFRYHNHENTVLNKIKEQLLLSNEVDKAELIEFIHSITQKKDSRTRKTIREGSRNMIDLFDLVLNYYYSPLSKGSNSIKDILPAIISESKFLKEKYGKLNVYGKELEIHSLNFDNHVWIPNEKTLNPYKTLPRVFEEYANESIDAIDPIEGLQEVNNGGAALTAYNYLQYSNVSEEQRMHLRDALFRYCELDTLAMVMILEGWNEKMT